MSEIRDRIAELSMVDILAGATDDDVAAVAAIGTERRIESGEVIFRDGDPGESVLIVLDGWVRCTRNGEEITEIGPGETFGLMSFLDQGPRNVDAVAAGPVRLFVLERSALMGIVDQRPRIMKGMYSVMSRHLRSVVDVAASRRALRG